MRKGARAGAREGFRELALAGILGAASLMLPLLFHAVHLGAVFMPMYIPLLALGFLVRPPTAVATCALAPLLSALLTGMPPLVPPVALLMSAELALMGLAISGAARGFPRLSSWVILPAGILAGRILSTGAIYAAAPLLDFPPGLAAGFTFLAGWPGLLIAVAVVPPLVAQAGKGM
ncbi:MAG: ECF transporter S component [Bacteroidota bacterium]